MSKNDGGPAFPTSRGDLPGMSLRDYFAAKAMAGMIANGDFIIDRIEERELASGEMMKKITRPRTQGSDIAYKIADAMLAAREKSE